MNFAGFPNHTSPAGTGFVTTLPAPIMAFSPIVTPARIVEFAPILAPFFISVFDSFQSGFFERGNKSLVKVTL